MRSFRIFLLGMAALLLLNCAAPIIPDPAQSRAPTQISGAVVITFGAQEFQRAFYEPLIARFQQEEPAIRVQFVATDAAYAAQPGNPDPDAALRRIATLADSALVYTIPRSTLQRGFLRDMTPLIEADPDFNLPDFYPGVLERTHFAGGQYGVPLEVTTPLLSYNRDLWRSAGLPPPRPDWTWLDLLAAAETLAHPDSQGMDVYGLADWGAYLLFAALAQQQEPAFTWSEAGQARLDAPVVEETLMRLMALKQSGALLYLPPSSTPDQIGATIREGRIGMWDSQLLIRTPGDASQALDVGTAVLPPVRGFETRFGRELVMSNGVRHPEATWRWIAFLSRQAAPEMGSLAMPPTSFPARRSLVAQSGILSRLDPEMRAAIEATLERPPETLIPVDPLRDQLLTQAMDAVLTNGEAPVAALADAQHIYTQSFTDAALTPSPGATEPLVVASPIPTLEARQDVPRITFTAIWASSIFQPLVDAFNREHPEMYVELRSDEIRSGSFRLADVARDSDVVLWTGPAMGEDQNAVLDLRPFADADPLYAPEDFPLALRSRFGDGQALYGVPYQMSLAVLAYNRDIFIAGDVTPPQADWTLDDFVLAAESLSGGVGRDRRYGLNLADTALLDLFLDNEDVVLVLGSGESIQPNFTDPKVVAAARRFIDFVRVTTPDARLNGYQRATWRATDDLIAEGRVAMWFVFSRPLVDPALRDVPVSIAPVPHSASGVRRAPFSAMALFISSETAYPHEAWRFVSWMSRHPQISAGYIPARTSLARAPSFQATMPPGMAEVYDSYIEMLEQPEDRSRFHNAGPVEMAFDFYWFHRAIDRALQNPALDVERELHEAQQRTTTYLDCVWSGETSARCAYDVDPAYKGFQ